MHRARQFLRKMAQPATTARSVPSPRPRETWGGPDAPRAITCAQAETVSLDFEQLRRSNAYVASAATAAAADPDGRPAPCFPERGPTPHKKGADVSAVI